MAARKNKHIGSSLDDFLEEEGMLDELRAASIKKVIAWQIEQAMKARDLDKVAMAELMKTSRAQLDRLLDPTDGNVTLKTLERAASALGKELQIVFA